MDENELKIRRQGFMTAIGLVLKNADAATKKSVLKILGSFGPKLHTEVLSDAYSQVAQANNVNPCPEGFHWDEIQMACIPD